MCGSLPPPPLAALSFTKLRILIRPVAAVAEAAPPPVSVVVTPPWKENPRQNACKQKSLFIRCAGKIFMHLPPPTLVVGNDPPYDDDEDKDNGGELFQRNGNK